MLISAAWGAANLTGESAPGFLILPVVLILFSIFLWFLTIVQASEQNRLYSINFIASDQIALNIIGLVLFIIELISIGTRAISLGLRLFANLLSGSIIEELIDATVQALMAKIVLVAGLSILQAAVVFFIYNTFISFGELVALFV